MVRTRLRMVQELVVGIGVVAIQEDEGLVRAFFLGEIQHVTVPELEMMKPVDSPTITGPGPSGLLDDLARISQVASIFSAARRRFCYKNHEVVACMERWIWHTRWVNRNRGAFGSILTAA